MGRGERKRRRAPDFREPLPKPQRVPCWRAGRPSPPHHLSSRTGKRVCERGGAWPDCGPGMGGHGRARAGPARALRHLLSSLLALGERTWRAGSKPSSCREMRCARCRCCTGSTSPSRSGTTWRSGSRASRGRCPRPHLPPRVLTIQVPRPLGLLFVVWCDLVLSVPRCEEGTVFLGKRNREMGAWEGRWDVSRL